MRLDVEEAPGPAIQAGPGRDAQALVRSLASAALPRQDALVDRLVDEVWGEVYLPGGPVSRDDLWRSCRHNIGNMLTVLSGTGPSGQDLMHSARSTGERRARQRCPLPWVLHAWRVGGQVIWEDLSARAGLDDRDELRLLVSGASTVWGVAERFSAEMASTYRSVEQQLAGEADPHRQAVLDAVLDGYRTQPPEQAYRTLGLRRHEPLAVAAVEESPGGPGSTRQVHDLLRRHGVHAVWRQRAGSGVAVLALRDRSPGEVARLLAAHARGRVGISPAVTGLGEVPAAWRMATLALSLVPVGGSGAVALDDHLPEALLLSSPELGQRLVRVTLGPLLDLPADERDELVRTISTWIASMGSGVRAAKLLYCHRNTVLNRLHRVQALTGLDLTATAGWPQVMLALSALRCGLDGDPTGSRAPRPHGPAT